MAPPGPPLESPMLSTVVILCIFSLEHYSRPLGTSACPAIIIIKVADGDTCD